MTQQPVSPPPGAGGLSVAQQAQLANVQALNSTSTAKPADTPITLTDLPPQIQLLLTQAGIQPASPPGTASTWTAASFAAALAGVHNPALVSNIQQMLFYSGAYPSSVTSLSQLPLGSFTATDAGALTKSVTDAGSLGEGFGTYLNQSANVGKAQGILTQLSGAGQTPVKLPNGLDEDAVLRAQAESILGRTADAQDLAGFRAFYNQAVLDGSKQQAAVDAQQQAQALPDAGTLGTAIGDSTLNPDGTFTSNLSTTAPTQADAIQTQKDADTATLGAVTAAGASVDSAQPSTYTAPPNMQVAADQFLTQNHPGQVQAQKYADVTKSLYSILAGSGA